MNKFFNQYVDMAAMVLTLLLPLILTLLIKRKTASRTRAIPAYFLLFGPAGILVFIFFHLFENSYHAIDAAIAGTFIYTFRFYSILLLGVVVAGIGYFFLRACLSKCLREEYRNRRIFQFILLMVVVTVPLIPIVSISAVPAICCVFSLAGLPFVRRQKKCVQQVQFRQEELLQPGK